MKKGARGFTVVELVVVIVVIALLAAIATVAYSSMQARARDTARLNDAKTIVDAAKLYKTYYGEFPKQQSTSWETSANYPTTFINQLVTSGILPAVPVDPTNSGNYYYRYYRYGAGSNNCDPARGPYFVFQIFRSEIAGNSSSATSPDSPGFKCGTRNWDSEAWYSIGVYTN